MATDLDRYASPIERRIAKAIVKDALAKGWSISVNDGGEWTVKRSTDAKTVLSALASTDSDTLMFREVGTGWIVGKIVLIWGNEEDLLSDHTDHEDFNAFIEAGRYY